MRRRVLATLECVVSASLALAVPSVWLSKQECGGQDVRRASSRRPARARASSAALERVADAWSALGMVVEAELRSTDRTRAHRPGGWHAPAPPQRLGSALPMPGGMVVEIVLPSPSCAGRERAAEAACAGVPSMYVSVLKRHVACDSEDPGSVADLPSRCRRCCAPPQM